MWSPYRELLDGMVALTMGDATIATNRTLKNSWLCLLKTALPFNIGDTTAVLAGNEANFEGYHRTQPAIINGPFVGQNNYSLGSGAAILWQPTGSDSPNTIFGQVLIGSDSSTMLAHELFDSPVPLATEENGFVDVPIIGVGPNAAGYGSSIITS